MAGKLTLIVDDSLQSAKLLLVLAGRCGVQAKVPGSGREVLEMMRARRPDLVLLDLFVPIMSDWKLLETMESDPHVLDVPVTVVSTQEHVPDKRWSELPHLWKPCGAREVTRSVRETSGRDTENAWAATEHHGGRGVPPTPVTDTGSPA